MPTSAASSGRGENGATCSRALAEASCSTVRASIASADRSPVAFEAIATGSSSSRVSSSAFAVSAKGGASCTVPSARSAPKSPRTDSASRVQTGAA